MLIVNLYGQPGSGKSTAAAYIFSKLKMAGLNVELVPEYAKEKIWENNAEVFKNQAYIFGKQFFRISRCEDKVDVVVTDAPLLLSVLYNNDDRLGKPFDETVKQVANSYESLNYLLTRVSHYNPIGRQQTEEESDALIEPLKKILDECCEYTELPGDVTSYDKIAQTIIDMFVAKEKGNK